MATGRKTVAPGQTIATDWGNLVWDQSVQTFATAADRATQFPAPKPGAPTYLEDVRRLEVWSGTKWVAVLGTIPGSLVGGFVGGNNVVSTNASGAFTLPISPAVDLKGVVASAEPGAYIVGINSLASTGWNGTVLYSGGAPVANAVARVYWLGFIIP